jgi:hypothetical protein
MIFSQNQKSIKTHLRYYRRLFICEFHNNQIVFHSSAQKCSMECDKCMLIGNHMVNLLRQELSTFFKSEAYAIEGCKQSFKEITEHIRVYCGSKQHSNHSRGFAFFRTHRLRNSDLRNLWNSKSVIFHNRSHSLVIKLTLDLTLSKQTSVLRQSL